MVMSIILNKFFLFLVSDTPQGDTELSYRVLGEGY